MGRNQHLNKGNLLEDAIEKIQFQIFKTNPSLKDSNYSIERKKVININGVRRELDLFIKLDPGNDLESIFIFECKNWDDSVDANSITIFNKKVTDTNATKGFFIAKKYSKDAISEAKQYSRIVLLKASTDFIDVSTFPPSHVLFQDKSKRKIEFEIIPFGVAESEGSAEKVEISLVILNGEVVSHNQFIDSLVEKSINERLQHEPTHQFDIGIYPYSIKRNFEFEKSALKINSEDIKTIIVNIDFEIQILQQIIEAKFDIERKGRYLQMVSNFPTGGKLEMSFIAIK